MATIKIGTLIKDRRSGKAKLRVEEGGVVRIEELRISFLKPTESLWRELSAIEKNDEGQDEKSTIVAMLLKVDFQSPDITNDDGTVHQITEADLLALGIEQLVDLKEGVQDHFLLVTPEQMKEMNTKSISAPAAE